LSPSSSDPSADQIAAAANSTVPTKGASRFTRRTAIAVVMANMVGTGVFTSLGFQLADIRSVFVLLLLWVIGGLAALCGALCYAELGALSRVLHPGVGFVAGWVSATIGFAAPSALAAITFGAYFSSVFPELNNTVLACVLVVGLTLLHSISHRSSAATQGAFTWLKVLLIIGFCALATNRRRKIAHRWRLCGVAYLCELRIHRLEFRDLSEWRAD